MRTNQLPVGGENQIPTAKGTDGSPNVNNNILGMFQYGDIQKNLKNAIKENGQYLVREVIPNGVIIESIHSSSELTEKCPTIFAHWSHGYIVHEIGKPDEPILVYNGGIASHVSAILSSSGTTTIH